MRDAKPEFIEMTCSVLPTDRGTEEEAVQKILTGLAANTAVKTFVWCVRARVWASGAPVQGGPSLSRLMLPSAKTRQPAGAG